jgi:hypothetical protein
MTQPHRLLLQQQAEQQQQQQDAATRAVQRPKRKKDYRSGSKEHHVVTLLDPETYAFLVPEHSRQDAQVYRGSAGRLHAKLRAWAAGQPLMLAAVGASITAGQGVVDGQNHTWPARLESLLVSFSAKQGYGPVSLANGGAPGATSMFMSVCLRTFVPEQADVVVVEFAS